ncbi:hypothetical protein Tco_1327996, partial [Tanacetum coccineum]
LTEIMTSFAPMEVGTVFEPAEASFDVEKLLAEARLNDCLKYVIVILNAPLCPNALLKEVDIYTD